MDNSRSMAENGCAGAACEATVLLARALTRLEVGSLGIVRFGGASPPGELHPLGLPFTEAQGPAVLAGLRFDQVPSPGPSWPLMCRPWVVAVEGAWQQLGLVMTVQLLMIRAWSACLCPCMAELLPSARHVQQSPTCVMAGMHNAAGGITCRA